MARTATGDRAAFTALVERHQAAVYRYLSVFGTDHADVEDALQDTFINVWRHAAGYRGDGSARAWMLSIARRALSRHLRRRAGEPDQFVSIEALGVDAGWGHAEDDTTLERIANREVLERALARLPSAERETVQLRDGEGLTGEEVAALTGVSVAAMKSRLHRGRLRLAAAIRELE